jgi:hypothetical protein
MIKLAFLIFLAFLIAPPVFSDVFLMKIKKGQGLFTLKAAGCACSSSLVFCVVFFVLFVFAVCLVYPIIRNSRALYLKKYHDKMSVLVIE